MVIDDVREAPPPVGSSPLERVTPRIDSQTRCRCGAGQLVWDEVFGWLHLANLGLCPTPTPVGTP